jgi:hypothetical protein
MYNDPNALDWENPENDIDFILGYNNKRTNRIARKIAKKLKNAKDRCKNKELTWVMCNLTLNDNKINIDAAQFEDLKLIPDDNSGFRIIPA